MIRFFYIPQWVRVWVRIRGHWRHSEQVTRRLAAALR